MGDAPYWRLVEEIFHQALDVPADERAAFVHEHCGGDAALARDVRGTLAGYEAQERISALHARKPLEGACFGAFEIVRIIGEGGMGAVYLARRIGDFEQRAAIKLISGTPAAAALLAERFLQERQILAGFEHPNIARLLDGGVTGDGQPFLVMEYVEGVRLDEYCRSTPLSVRGRLKLFRKICEAVHFAHQHLVIHRDLKPGNILVTEQGEPKLLDFGIAKILAAPGSATEQTITLMASLLLTPQYASPEQIQGHSCTVASDIYSLGVILYELLAHQSPYSATASTPAEIIAAAVTGEAQRPSVVAPEKLRARLRGDLDSIVMKALARKPTDRYGSVDQFSEDVRRHLEGLPVIAVEGTRVYIARKFLRRHRVGVAAAAFILFSLIAGLAGTMWQARVADRERVLAEQRFSDSRKLANYLLFPLFDSVQSLPGSLPVQADMASQSLLYLDRLAADKGKNRALSLELAEGYLRLGQILEAPLGGGDSLGNASKALESDQKALTILEPLMREVPSDVRVQQDLARGYFQLGPALNFLGKSREGIAKLSQAIAIFDRLAAASPHGVACRVDAGRAYVALMDVIGSPGGGLSEQGTKDQVLAAASKAYAHFDAAIAMSPADSRALLGLARAENLAGTLQMVMDPRAGIASVQKGLDALHKLPPAMRGSPQTQIDETRMETTIAFGQAAIGQFADALRTLQHSREVYERLAVVDPKNGTNTRRRITLYRTLAMVQMGLGNKREALAAYRKVIELTDGLVALDPSKLSNFVIGAEAQGRAAGVLAAEGRMHEATEYAKASIDTLKRIADRPDAAAQNLSEAAVVLMVTPIPSLRDYPRALGYAKRAYELSGGKEPGAIVYLAQAYANNGDAANALETVRQGLTLAAPAPRGEKPSEVRRTLEGQLRDIQIFIKTGSLPVGFNQP
jgi:serine/threonine protein kinase/tetratricopeptide (TPR) repeat protein